MVLGLDLFTSCRRQLPKLGMLAANGFNPALCPLQFRLQGAKFLLMRRKALKLFNAVQEPAFVILNQPFGLRLKLAGAGQSVVAVGEFGTKLHLGLQVRVGFIGMVKRASGTYYYGCCFHGYLCVLRG